MVGSDDQLKNDIDIKENMKLSTLASYRGIDFNVVVIYKVSKEGTIDNPVWPDAVKTTFRHDTQHGLVDWDNVRQIEARYDKDQIYELIGRPHFQEGLYGVRSGFICSIP